MHFWGFYQVLESNDEVPPMCSGCFACGLLSWRCFTLMFVASTVEQEQIQKRTFTNWINAQLSKKKPPCVVLDLFNDIRDGSLLLDLLEVMSGQQMVSLHYQCRLLCSSWLFIVLSGVHVDQVGEHQRS
uniref:Calponin-homology (CH) domain-containing protein n=1 Tax=Scleropages formosus TaxID=113540 RepID=A0A8C9VNQ5_SCLFO